MTVADDNRTRSELRSGARIGYALGELFFDPKSLPWLLPLIGKYKFKILLLVILGAVSALVALVPPYLTKLIIDDGLMVGDQPALIIWSLLLLGFGMFALGFGALNNILHMRESVQMLADLRRLLINAVLRQSQGWRAQQQTGELLNRLDGDAGEVQKFAFNALLSGTGSVLKLFGGGIMLMMLNWQLGLIAVSLAPIELLFLNWARPRTERQSVAVREAKGRFASRLSEMFYGLTALQTVNGDNVTRSSLQSDQTGLNRSLLRAQKWGEFTRAVPQFLTAIVRFAIFLVGGLMVIEGHWPLGSLIAFIAYLGFLIGPMQTLLGLWHTQARVKISVARLNDVMAVTGVFWPEYPSPLPHDGGHILLKNISFDIHNAGVKENVDFEIRKGEKIRLAGPSGIGKTTLLMLLQRHRDPVQGEILIDGVELSKIARETLRKAVTIVPQRPFLIRGTVAENLRLSNPQADNEHMLNILSFLGLDDRFTSENSLDRLIGEDGLTLSGGERQRLCLARALLAPFRILVMDETLSEVEPALVRSIVEKIDQRWGHCTRIISTHGAEDAYGGFDKTIHLNDVGKL